jgi:uncharacterized protein (TIGR02268 family)
MTTGVLLSLFLSVASGAAPAKAAPAPASHAGTRELRRRALTLTDATVDKLPELHVGKGTPTVVTFQSDIEARGVLLGAAQGLFYPTQQTSRMVILAPVNDLEGAVPVNVQLKDGTILTFQVRSSRQDVDVQVDVFLELTRRASPDSPATLRETIGGIRMQLDECRATSGDAGAQKLASLLLTQSLDSPQAFDRRPLHTLEKQSRLLIEGKWAYRLLGLTYVILTVENRDPARSWVLDRADVSIVGGKDKSDVKVSAIATEYQSLAPDQAGRVVLSFPTPSNAGTQKIVITLYERDGGRIVALPAMEI